MNSEHKGHLVLFAEVGHGRVNFNQISFDLAISHKKVGLQNNLGFTELNPNPIVKL